MYWPSLQVRQRPQSAQHGCERPDVHAAHQAVEVQFGGISTPHGDDAPPHKLRQLLLFALHHRTGALPLLRHGRSRRASRGRQLAP
eukprot:CAMPEP_0198437270 /NCGR_PEP_ID=MMETSP1452-20131203/46187_1 /TAXON_ID=1181717 /ORGANISM="Synchroma pusillum, Strain CCMP3072" /LENGTH=85 /DNA_ID=CAMNT_0044157835 /DNA_START=17 /DNA_END=271 /DNA_ORIENTATION=+